MKNKRILCMAALLGASLAAAQAQTIADWDFDTIGTQAAPYNNPSATTGTGTATALGMNNSYNSTTSLTYADVLATAGASTGSGSYAWRIRGGSTSGGAGSPNGWSSQAPIGTQGAEFAASTAGFANVSITFDLYTTSAAEANVCLLYTTDGTTWNDATLTYSGTMTVNALNNTTSANTVMGPYLHLATSGGGWYNGITANLSGVTAVNNNPNFAIEIVNASTGADDINQTGGAYNNTSGNWRYDNIDITGAVVPEPTSMALMGVGLAAAALVGLRKSRKA